jgi:hypothetical protein
VYGNTAFGTVTCHLLLPDIRESLANKTDDTRDATPSFRAAYCLEHHGRSTRMYGVTSQKTALLTLSVTLRYCVFKYRDLEQFLFKDLISSTRIMKARKTLSTRLQDTSHRKQKSSNYFVLVKQSYCLSKSTQVFKLALVGYTASIVRLDFITLTVFSPK